MDASGGFGSRVIEAIECLAALRGRQTRANEQFARRHRKRLSKLREEGGVELSGRVEQQAAI
jgi:hypothetical protein